jgi:hypothetical protein
MEDTKRLLDEFAKIEHPKIEDPVRIAPIA